MPDSPLVRPNATCWLWPIAITGAPGAVIPRTFSPAPWSSSSYSSSGAVYPSSGPLKKVAWWCLRSPIAAMYEPPRRIGRTSDRAAAEEDALTRGSVPRSPAAGRGSFRSNFAERRSAVRSCLRLRPGRDGKSPEDRGTVAIWPRMRSGRIVSRLRAPLRLSALSVLSSMPSPFGVVRAR